MKKRIGIIMLIISMVLTESLTIRVGAVVNAKEAEREILVCGTANLLLDIPNTQYYIKSSKALTGNVVHIQFTGENGETKEFVTYTNQSGDYEKRIQVAGTGTVNVEIEANNIACIVRDLSYETSNEIDEGAYYYRISENYKVAGNTKQLHIPIKLMDEKYKSAFVIAQYMYDMYCHVSLEIISVKKEDITA